eukprot:10727950-Prorocentrum_lima.AAC.1
MTTAQAAAKFVRLTDPDAQARAAAAALRRYQEHQATLAKGPTTATAPPVPGGPPKIPAKLCAMTK